MNRMFKLRKDVPSCKDWHFKDIFNHINPHLNWFWDKATDAIDLRPYDSPIKDQGKLGSCGLNATSKAIEFLQLQELKANLPIEEANEVFTSGQFEAISRLYLYWNVREIEGTTNEDSGVMLRDCCTAIATKGFCRESVWPYDITKAFIKPADAAYVEASKHLAHYYFRINGLDEAKKCLKSGFPFILGITVFEDLMKVKSDGVLSMPHWGEQPLGGHAVTCLGFDDAKKHLIIANSWGTSWGDGGYFYLPYSYFNNANLTSDCWTIRRSK